MNRQDLLDLERHYARTLRREASKRARKAPAVAEQLTRWAEAAEGRAEAIRVGPLFDREGA
jgi:hypothetical protein